MPFSEGPDISTHNPAVSGIITAGNTARSNCFRSLCAASLSLPLSYPGRRSVIAPAALRHRPQTLVLCDELLTEGRGIPGNPR